MSNEQHLSRRDFISSTAMGMGVLLSSVKGASGEEGTSRSTPVEVRQERRVLDVKVDGLPFAVYNFDSTHAALYRPFFYPVMGPNNKPITQNGEFPGSLRGHYWHRSLFVAHQKVNGISFWEERAADCGRMIHLGFDEMTSGEEGGFVERLAWRDLEGQDLLHEVRTVRVPHAPRERRLLDIAIRLKAVSGHAYFASTPYNLLACRVINAMCPIPQKERYKKRYGALVDFSPMNEGGIITNSEGKENEACRGERAKWCDFSGPLGDGTWGGIALLDHPGNPRHPTPWHNWNNMTITASFTFREPFTVQKGRELCLNYRVVVHAADAKKADIAATWQDFSKTQPVGI